MSTAPQVSIVVSFYNAQRFLGDTIESVCTQTFQDWELLLVDDGSWDESTAIAREYAQRYPTKVRYIEHPNHQNRGASPSRNVGIRAARGEYIALLDADDIWLPHKLERQVAIMRTHPEVGMVYGKPLYWHTWAPEATHRDVESGLGVPAGSVVSPPRLVWRSYPLGPGASPVLSDILFRASIVKRIGLFEESFIGKDQMYEDQIFLSKVYVSETVYVSGEFWTKYRQHVESCMGQGRWSGEYDGIRKRYLTWFGGYLAQRSVRDPRIWGALQRAWLPYRYPRLAQAFGRGRQLAGRARNLAVAAIMRRSRPLVGRVRWGDLGGLEPISRASGFRRGQPIDRLYIERFLEQHHADIHGATLEAGDDTYTRRFGGTRALTRDVLHASPGNPQATIVADLADAGAIESERFDCIILTQTLQYVADLPAAIHTLHRILKPGGVLLATLPGLGPISRDDWAERWCWGFTAAGARHLFEPLFGRQHVEIQSFGNVLTATAFLQGLAVADLPPRALEQHDQSYQIVITIRAVKAEARL